MPVIYSQKTGTKGFFPCSRTYKQTITRAIQTGDTLLANELFQQGHKLVWQYQPSLGQYVNKYWPSSTLTIAEYQRIARLTPSQLTINDVNQQCGQKRIPRPSAFIGPQIGMVRGATRNMGLVQTQSYDTASRSGFPVQGFKGRALYAPSPFPQQVNEDGVYYPTTERAQVCSSEVPCTDGLVCESKVCVIPKAQRQCPPFQYPVTLRDSSGEFTIDNPSALRTVKTTRYSPYWNEWYDTCVPPDEYSSQRWILDKRLRRYIGLALDVKLIPEPDWTMESSSHEILHDPATDAPYYLSEEDGNVVRVYKLKSAYTPRLASASAATQEEKESQQPQTQEETQEESQQQPFTQEASPVENDPDALVAAALSALLD